MEIFCNFNLMNAHANEWKQTRPNFVLGGKRDGGEREGWRESSSHAIYFLLFFCAVLRHVFRPLLSLLICVKDFFVCCCWCFFYGCLCALLFQRRIVLWSKIMRSLESIKLAVGIHILSIREWGREIYSSNKEMLVCLSESRPIKQHHLSSPHSQRPQAPHIFKRVSSGSLHSKGLGPLLWSITDRTSETTSPSRERGW